MAPFISQTGVFAMEIWCQYDSYAFSTKGSGYATERSALYGRDKAIFWHSYSIMGVSCLQQHVINSPQNAHIEKHRNANRSHNPHTVTVSAAILFLFPV